MKKSTSNLGYAVIVTVILVIVAVFIGIAVSPDSDEGIPFLGEILAIFNLIAIIYFGKTILDKLDK